MVSNISDQDLETKKLEFERYKFDRQLTIERFKMIWISGILGAVVAGLGYLGTTKVAEPDANKAIKRLRLRLRI